MATSRQLKDIARTFVTLAHEHKVLVECIHDLRLLQSVFRAEPGMLADLSELAIPLDARDAALQEGLTKQVHGFVTNTLRMLQAQNELQEFSQFLEAVLSYAQTAGWYQEAIVSTTVPLNKHELQSIQAKLEGMTGGNVEITERIDPSIAGGLLIEMGGKRIDGSVRAYCQQLQQALSLA